MQQSVHQSMLVFGEIPALTPQLLQGCAFGLGEWMHWGVSAGATTKHEASVWRNRTRKKNTMPSMINTFQTRVTTPVNAHINTHHNYIVPIAVCNPAEIQCHFPNEAWHSAKDDTKLADAGGLPFE